MRDPCPRLPFTLHITMGQSWGWHTSRPLTARWPGPNHMAMVSLKGPWEMQSDMPKRKREGVWKTTGNVLHPQELQLCLQPSELPWVRVCPSVLNTRHYDKRMPDVSCGGGHAPPLHSPRALWPGLLRVGGAVPCPWPFAGLAIQRGRWHVLGRAHLSTQEA